MKNTADLVQAIIAAYVSVMGAEAWNALNAQQQHDVIMAITRDALHALDAIDTKP